MKRRSGAPAHERARAAFENAFGGPPDFVARAPGRINLIGEHVDYNDGLVLPAAIDRDVVVCGRAGGAGRRLHVVAHDRGETGTVELTDTRSLAIPPWLRYFAGAAGALAERHIALPSADLAVAGDVPPGAGLSSSAALEVATITLLLALADRALDPLAIASAARHAESAWTGVQCGIMDPYIAAHGRAGHALLLDCREQSHTHVPIPEHLRIVAVDSGTERTLAASAYNARVAECAAAARALGATSLRDVSAEQLGTREHLLQPLLFRRARHVVSEIGRVRSAADALARHDLPRLAEFIHASHESLRDDYHVSTTALDTLVRIARLTPGVHGSRLTGAGFGGCILALVEADAVAGFVRDVPAAYERTTGLCATVHVCVASTGSGLIG
jgi:galactokinase